MEIVRKNYLTLGVLGTLVGGYLTVGFLFSLAHMWPLLGVGIPILVLGLLMIKKGIKKENPADRPD